MITILVALKETKNVLGYGYYHVFHGYISELLGNDTYGKLANDYIYSNICGGDFTVDGFTFGKSKPYFYIRTGNEKVWQNFLKNISRKKNILEGFTVDGFSVVNDNLSRNVYETNAFTPILVSKKYNNTSNLSSDEILDSEKYMVESVKRKAKEIGFDVDPNLSIEILVQRKNRKINYRGIINNGRNLKLRLNCNEKTKEFILSHGIGRSTGCGFGFLL